MVKRLARLLLPDRWRLSHVSPRRLRRQVASRTGGRVASGPFVGMPYIDASWGSVWEPKLLGIYERELHGAVAEAIDRRPTRVVDIGAAEGYYAVGLARALPEAEVWSFELDARAHVLIRDLATRNGVAGRVRVEGACTPETLRAAVGDGEAVLVVCDVEGAEMDLLDPVRVPGLIRASVLVELHPGQRPGVWEAVRDRFTSTHAITAIDQQTRTRADYPYPTPLVPAAYVLNAVSEHRQPWEPWMRWYWMVPTDAP